ncbi:3'(2'),5'-bisphosphate nucleotidase 1-like [Oppia nitens]|uniref:3'(2'),5'-bisphosphate nucleotidase 1-like n=1 Tax=Oppia nitens TaxID=1686743 RepID=UPI0023DC17E4|nr:3'(2'),5'-bisphosphate nucleotidase 1-like [Oppia nitens]
MIWKTMSNNLVLRILSSSVNISAKAGSIVRDVMKTGELAVVDKGVNDLQTEADRRAQNCIITSLSKQFPKIAIIGEETLDPNDKIDDKWIVSSFDESVLSHKCPEEWLNVTDEDIVVWVDPLDGTSEYTQGLLDHVTVLIGLSVKGRAIGGVIHQPFYNFDKENDSTKLGRTIWGLVGLGAYGFQHRQPPVGKVIVTTTRSHSSPTINAAIEHINPDEVIRVGGAGHKVLLVIEGQAHAYVFPSRGCKKWDTCAPEAVLESLGGRLTDVFGNQLRYDRNVEHTNELGVLATHCARTSHPYFLAKFSDDIKASLLSSSQMKRNN